ncbi:gamma-tubulin complex subunit [Strigomonas culicis]|uniref:Spindle pole body component n=1 Tax=Strigomonas culicis TaxID=28005 RepID=S9UC01_9TRYP|nr:gamma-tubulin complex subunit [Strigomonas culicis]|eukprot:EPY26269.1 gamma-tubulin complex subunit [Strigomonas culicis]
MSTEWKQFIIVLESKGVTFEQIRGASDRAGVLASMGFTEPLKRAILETEWRRRVGDLDGGAGASPGGVATTSGVFVLPHGSSPGGGGSKRANPTTAVTREEARALLQQPDRGLTGIPEELQDTVLTAEVLAAALGFGGVYLALSGRSGEGFSVSDKVPLSMRGLCQTILPVADAFVALREVEKAEYTGKTLVAMALGEVISEVCTSYAHEITKLTRWSEDKTMPLMGVVSEVLRVGQHMVRLRQLLPMDLLRTDAAGEDGLYGQPEAASARARMMDTYNSLLGTRILNHLSGQAERNARSSEEEELRLLLLRRSLVPYLRVLHQWMHAGVLGDPYGEFFITENAEPAARKSRVGMLSAAQRQHTRRLFPEAAFFGLYGISGGNEIEASPGQQEVVAFERRFSMNKKMIPSILEKPSRVAKMIFFAGKYCCLLREYNGSLPNFGEAAADMLVWTDVDDLHRKIQDSFEIASSAVIRLLLSPQIDLLGHVNSLKSYFLQSRGDWMVSFLDAADELLSKAPDKVKVNSLRVLLQAAIARSCGNDPYHGLIGCSFSDSTLSTIVQRLLRQQEGGGGGEGEGEGELLPEAAPHGRSSGRLSSGAVDAQQCVELLQLEVDLQWPITLVLDAATLRRFNAIFRLLTAVKVCERRLSAVFFNNEVLATFSTAYGIKHQLVQFLQQFHFYATRFVLEPQWERLLLRLGQSDSVFGLSQALQDFFTQAERGLVLSSAPRFRSLSKVLELGNRLCEVGLHSSTATLPLIESTLSSIEDSFLQALSELSSPVGADYAQLVPLFTWIDFNGFYARHHVYHVQSGGSTAVTA